MATESSKMTADGTHNTGQEQEQNDPAAIRAEMQATREDLADTVNALQERLSPQRIREDAMESMRRSTIGRVEIAADDVSEKVKGVGNDVFETIKRNPAPAALAAVGLGWLFMESRNRSRDREMERYGRGRGRQGDRHYYANEQYGRGAPDYNYTYDEYGRRSFASDDPYGRDHYRNEGQGIRERAEQAAGQVESKVQDVAGQATEAVQGAAESAKQTAGEAVDSARQGVQQVAYQAQYRAERVGNRFGEIMQENPLMVGAAAVALGALVGFAFPATEKENELMGEARDRVMDRAQSVASETAQKVQYVAKEATAAAKEAANDEAQKQNLTSGTNR